MQISLEEMSITELESSLDEIIKIVDFIWNKEDLHLQEIKWER